MKLIALLLSLGRWRLRPRPGVLIGSISYRYWIKIELWGFDGLKYNSV